MTACEEFINIPDKTIEMSTDNKKSNRLTIMKFLMEKSGLPNMTKERAAGICGNIATESGYNHMAVNPSSKAFGLCQWLGVRKKRLKIFAVDNQQCVRELELQLKFLVHELTGTEKKAWTNVTAGANDVETATWLFCRWFERPGVTTDEILSKETKIKNERVPKAKAALSAYDNGTDDNIC
jgi:hypothetical protein